MPRTEVVKMRRAATTIIGTQTVNGGFPRYCIDAVCRKEQKDEQEKIIPGYRMCSPINCNGNNDGSRTVRERATES